MIAATLETIKQEHIKEVVTREIWQRGYGYFKHNSVLSLSHNRHTLTASVQGNNSHPYQVQVVETDRHISHMTCTCPYAARWGWVCKHIVAVLLIWIHQRDKDDFMHFRKPGSSYPDTIINSENPFYSIFSSWFSSFEKMGMYVDLTGSGPQLEITLRSKTNDRKAKLIIPAIESPMLYEQIRALQGVEWSDKAAGVRLNKQLVTYELKADYDGDNRLMLTPGYSIKMHDNTQVFMDLEQAKQHVINGRWFWYDNAYSTIEDMPETIKPYFDGDKPLVYKGTEIIDFFTYSMPAVEHEKRFKPSERVKTTHIISSPEIGRIKVEGEGEWLYLAPYYDVAGVDLSLEELIRSRDESGFVRNNNNWVYVPENTIKVWSKIGTLTDDKKIKISKIAYARLRSEINDTISIEEPEQIGKFYTELNRVVDPAPAPTIDNMNGTLRDYQKTGYNWLWFLYTNQLNGILADEMGLGKTHQTMAVLSSVYKNGNTTPSLVVAPTSVIDHWEYKLHEYLPWIKVNKYHDKNRSLQDSGQYHIVLTTYAVMSLDIGKIADRQWEYVILDEAQKIKNHTTKAYRAAKSLLARHRLALTGTPIENRLTELWSIFDFLMPGYLGPLDGFVKEYELPIEKYNDEDRKETLKRIINPFKLRRLKADVLKELPRKLEDVRYCSLTPHQVSLYKHLINTQGSELLRTLSDETKPIEYMHIFSLITKLKRLCDHPALIMDGHEKSQTSGKFDLFKTLVEEAADSGEKIVVFSQYLEMLDLIEKWLKSKKMAFASLRGSTRKRAEVISRFQKDSHCRVFVGSLMAGGLGIDLTSASVVIHYDRWWNAAREDQATDRVHRIGQRKGVQVFKLITRGTLEEKIDNLIKEKASLMNSIIKSDDVLIKKLSRENIMELFRAPV